MPAPRANVEPEKITVRQCVMQLAELTQRYANCDESQWEAFGDEVQGMIDSLDNSNPFHVGRVLRRLQREDREARENIAYLRQEDLLRLLPQEPQNIRGCILSLDSLRQITIDDSQNHIECLERICRAQGLNGFKEVQKLYKTDEDVRKAIDRLLQRADLIGLMQHDIDSVLGATGVTQENACAFLIRKDYVGLVEGWLKSRPLNPPNIARSEEWCKQLDEVMTKIVAFVAITWSAQFLLPSTWEPMKNLSGPLDLLRPEPRECIERVQILYRTNLAFKKQIDGLLRPGYFNPDSAAKKTAVLFFIQRGMNFVAEKLGVSQEDAFGLLGQKKYADLARRILLSATV